MKHLKGGASYRSLATSEFVFCHPCGIIIMIFIVPTNFHTHCVRVSIQTRANIIIFYINTMYNIKPLIMFIFKGFVLYIHYDISSYLN
jgi:hypothetical protein